jgi:glyoxylase-like metal-dependent hydrolase (beta-lactamase superfamily II)
MITPPIHILDLKFQGVAEAIAAFLVLGPGGPVLIETGPGSTVPALERELARCGVTADEVRDVLITHIHLDHGGAAGWWARRGARVHVHPNGAPHLIAPSKLLTSAERIYGDRMQSLWGEYWASPAAQVVTHRDGEVIEAGGLSFIAHDTPGHARHHLVYQLGNVAFAGDLAGIRLSARPHTRLPTPPPEFDRDEWLASVERMRALKLDRLYLTHFGEVSEVAAQWEAVARLVTDSAEAARAALERGADREAIIAAFAEREAAQLAAAGVEAALYNSVGPLGMSVDGLLRYWRKKRPER